MANSNADPAQQEIADLERRIRDALAELRGQLDDSAGEQDPPVIDPGYLERWVDTAQRLSVQISNGLPPDLDPASVGEIRKIIVNLLFGLDHLDADRPLDAIDQYVVGAEAVRHILRDALDEHVGNDTGDAATVIDYLADALPRVTQSDRARIAGMSVRHLQRLGKEGGPSPRQLTLAARLVKLLRYTWNPEGVIAWFDRERPELDGQAPIDVAPDAGFEDLLLALARRGRAQHAA